MIHARRFPYVPARVIAIEKESVTLPGFDRLSSLNVANVNSAEIVRRRRSWRTSIRLKVNAPEDVSVLAGCILLYKKNFGKAQWPLRWQSKHSRANLRTLSKLPTCPSSGRVLVACVETLDATELRIPQERF